MVLNRTGMLIGVLFVSAIAWQAADVACAQGSDNGLVDLVVDLLADEDKDVRALALEQVRNEAKGRQATVRFAAMLPQLSPDAQVGLLSALSDRGDSAARPSVLSLVNNGRQQEVRVAAIAALGNLGETADSSLLVQLLISESDAERTAARESLVRLPGDSTSEAICQAMQRAAPSPRIVLLDVLVQRRATNTIPSILFAAVDDDPSVRSAAMKALVPMAGPEHVAAMVRAVLRSEPGAERAAAEKAVMFVCARIDDPQQRAAPLLAAMANLGDADRQAMLSTLGRVGGPAARSTIEAAVARPEEKLHELGLRALCNWPDASIAPRLLELAQSEKRDEWRIMALRALIRVAPLPDARPNAEKLALLKTAMSLATRDEERHLIIARARAIRTPETLRFIVPWLDEAEFAPSACESIVELAHHRGLREPNKAEFDAALGKVIATSDDATVIDRANRYKKGQTWVRPR